MSANCRAAASKLAKRYAKVFNIPEEEVEVSYAPDEDAEIKASKKYPDLPVWRTGPVP